MFTDLNVASNVPAYTTGWEAGAYTAVSFSVPDNWKAGRIWVRTRWYLSRSVESNEQQYLGSS